MIGLVPSSAVPGSWCWVLRFWFLVRRFAAAQPASWQGPGLRPIGSAGLQPCPRVLRRSRQHHPSRFRAIHDRHDRARRRRERGARGVYSAHAWRPCRRDARHRHEDDRGQDADCGVRGAVRRAGGLGGLHHHDRGRHRGDGAWHAYRRGASRRGRRRRDGRDELEESGRRHGRVRAHDRGQARPQCAAGRAGRAAEQGVHRRGGAEGHTSARRSRGDEPRRSAEEARRPHRDAIRRPLGDAAHRVGDGRADRDDAASAHPQRGCPSQHRVHPAEPRHARLDDRVVESGCHATRRRRRALAAAGVLRAAGAAHQLRRACC